MENPPANSPDAANVRDDTRARWIEVLQSLLPHTIGPCGAAIGDAVAGAWGRNRLFMVSCLRAVHAARAGVSVHVNLPLPPMSLPMPAADGSVATEHVWLAYVKYVSGDPAAGEWLAAACAALSPTALKTTLADNPEPWWQNEMLILHALHSYALIVGDEASLVRTIACADFHVREIQPDHATNEPWAVHAYASHPDGAITAETLLHSAQIQNAGTLSEVAQLIVADAVFALEAAARA